MTNIWELDYKIVTMKKWGKTWQGEEKEERGGIMTVIRCGHLGGGYIVLMKLNIDTILCK